MNLSTITQSDTLYDDTLYDTILNDFVNENPEFLSYKIYSPKTLKTNLPTIVKTVKQCIIYYICMQDVRPSFGNKLYKNIYTSHFLRKDDHKRTLIYANKNKKSSIEYALKLADDYSIEEFKNTIQNDTKISSILGLGVSGTTFVLTNFDVTPPWSYTEYTNIDVQKGMQIIYNLRKRPSGIEAKKIVDSWKTEYKLIGSMLCKQAYKLHTEKI